ncbi:hypothetical protein [Vampirovibrio sp.]|uniref:hypothetical protein n=1 Tax=Vampirovibrio sp. TaxID=2717857 RepID=UPI003593538A
MSGVINWSLFAIGALDALEPGHGKALISSFIAGSNAKIRHILLLGVASAGIHTFLNAVLALILSKFALILFKDAFLQGVQLSSGILILGMGLYLLVKSLGAKASHTQCCGGKHAGKGHSVYSPESLETMTTPKLLLLSLAGAAPCPIVLMAMVSAISASKGFEAFWGVLVFSLGMGAVLTGIGLLTYVGTHYLNVHWKASPDHLLRLRQASTVLPILLGCYLIFKAFFPAAVETESFSLLYTAAGK